MISTIDYMILVVLIIFFLNSKLLEWTVLKQETRKYLFTIFVLAKICVQIKFVQCYSKKYHLLSQNTKFEPFH